MPLKLRNGETILFTGDSITDCGRRADCAPLGSGYVKLFADMAQLREPRKQLNIINTGVGGNTVLDLKTRWADEVLEYAPDWLSIKIGINDLHRTLFPQEGIGPVSPALFRATYDELLSRTRKCLPGCRLLLVDPFYMSKDTAPGCPRAEVLAALPGYIRAVHEMSRKYRTRLVKTHDRFRSLLKYRSMECFGPEPVHPSLSGHLVIAEAVYEALSE